MVGPILQNANGCASVFVVTGKLRTKWVFPWTTISNLAENFGSPSVQHTRQFNRSVQHKKATPFQPQKSVSPTQKVSVQQKCVSSTRPSVQQKNRQFNTLVSSTPKTISSTHKKGVLSWPFLCWSYGSYVLNWRVCWADSFYLLNWRVCWFDAFYMLNWRIVLNGRFFVLNWRFLC